MEDQALAQSKTGESYEHTFHPDELCEDVLSMLSLCETASGGVGRYQDNLRAMSRYGMSCRVLLPDADRHILGPEADVVTFHRKKRGIGSLINMLRAFLAERKRRRPDVYFFNSTFSLVPLLVLRLIGDRTVSVYCAHCWAIGTLDPDSWKGRLIRAIEGTLCGLADLVINVSQSDLAIATRFGYRGRQIVLENAVGEADPDAARDLFASDVEGAIHLLFVGRFDRQKGLDVLLPAFSQARRRNAGLHLHLVGGVVRDGQTPAPREGVINHGWAGPHEIDSFYRSADALIVPSRWEGMPLVILEALRNATPVMASTGCGMSDFLERAGCGTSFELDSETLTALLAGLRRDDLIAARPAARATFEAHFTQARFGAALAREIRTMVGKRGGA
jgi:glycosyltransferase involved in cell wall biosynthesis